VKEFLQIRIDELSKTKMKWAKKINLNGRAAPVTIIDIEK
jgi:hypothetical protein